MRQAQAGDREAFETLVEQHATQLYRLAAAIVGPADARDLTQEAFVAAWTDLPRLRDADAFAPWLRRICVNRCRNWLRDRRSAPLKADPASAADLPDRNADFRDAVHTRVALEPAFARLSPDHRALLALHYSIGLPLSECADALGIPTGTAKSRLNAALGVLRAALGSESA